MLSSAEFPEFAADFVLYCNINSEIEGRPHDRMLLDIGGRGFPTLAFLNSDGKPIALYRGPPSIAGFRQAGAQLNR